MKKNILFIAVLFISVISFAQPPQGQEQGQRRSMDPEVMAKRQTENMVKTLGLSDDQTKKVEAINLAGAKKMKEAFDAAGDDRSSMRSTMQTLRKEQDDKLKEVLSEEQFTKYKEDQKANFEQRRKEREAKGQRGGGRGQGRGEGR